MINADYVQAFESDKQVTLSLVTVKVDLYPSRVMDALADALLAEVQRLAPSRGMKEIDELEADDILKYLKTLLYIRVNYVNNVKFKGYEDYANLSYELAVPALMSQILTSIGKVRDEEYNLEFIPTTTLSASDILAASEMRAISDILTRLHRNGLKVVFGIPRDRQGELGFMAMQHVEGQVLSYRKDHPVYGFLASFFAQQQLNEVTGTMARVVYGYENDYKYRVSALV